MRSLILNLREDKTYSETININMPENSFTLLPFKSNVKGLRLIFKYKNGEKKPVAIYETELMRNIENIGLFECFWFEYAGTDKSYPLNVLIK